MKSAIVGCGVIAKMHAQIIQSMEDCQLVAVADINYEKATNFTKENGIQRCNAYPSLEVLLQSEKIDVLHICTPHYLHVPMAIYAMSHGVHVFMEKPPAITREQFKLLETAQRNKYLGFCFQNRYNDSVKTLKAMLDDPKTGCIKGARSFVTWNREKKYYTGSDWRGTWETEGGGALINQSIHTLDLLVQLVGRPVQTEASLQNHHLKNVIAVEDTLEAYIEFETCSACFYATTAYSSNSPIFLELECENCYIRIEDDEVIRIDSEGKKEKVSFLKGQAIGKDYWGNGHEACIRDFYKSIQMEIPFSIDLDSVKDSFSLMMDIYQSAKEQRVICFSKGPKMTGFADEIDPDFEKQIKVLQECNISYMEL
jgi:UDP-N-acetyl-2-amino-2-deoxyglucuronate dehydrogenase